MLLCKRNLKINNRINPVGLMGKGKFSNGKPFVVRGMNHRGYIDCQWGMKAYRYGLFGSDYNGCGWISAYNALKLLGEDPSIPAVIYEFERYSVLFGTLGSTVLGFSHYFKNKGYKTAQLVSPNIQKVENFIHNHDASIIFYFHPAPFKGAHFAAAAPFENKIIFFNALNRSLRFTNSFADGIPIYRVPVFQDVRTLDEFVADEKKYYRSRIFPSPFWVIGISK
ncbi:MAG: hypothetical protein IKV41_03810 [Oscillospiraceae bacterium]|nr:hypothetical protein [Oscillospiraceae bacterium]